MMSEYLSIITDQGKDLEAAAKESGTQIELQKFVVGDGSGKQVTPDPARTALVNEVYRGDISSLKVSPDQSSQYIAMLVLPPDVGGFVVREVGLLTSDGVLYSVGSSPAIEKPNDGVSVNLQYRLAVSETESITLQVATGDGLFLRQDENLNDVNDKAESRKNLGLGSMAVQNANAVNITGGSATLNNSASNPLTVKSQSPCIKFEETDTGKSYWMVVDGSNIRLHQDSTAGTAIYTWDSASSIFTIAGTVRLLSALSMSSGGTGATTASGARSNLGLGTMATQNSNSVSITGGRAVFDSSASLPVVLQGSSPALRFTETDTGQQYFLLVDGSNIRLDQDSTAGISVFSWSKNSKSFSIGGSVNPSDYSNFDSRYQAKGSYYTTSQSDARYQLKNSAARSSSGWFKDASTGMIIQWGTVTVPVSSSATSGVSFSFPTSFPNAALSITATPARTGVSVSGNVAVVAVPSFTSSGGRITVDTNRGEAISIAQPIRYIAIGY
ncbi:phage tail protein [Enterobacteriaceae bacterium BIT-l23]|uniref:phage tail protein n=1 Tax=Jejubacter sp. L23 TaxID=3092086 RepID=UPI001584F5FA|nr:phage tail protein [Enterobacteriaceae bacterium BIT-l23]